MCIETIHLSFSITGADGSAGISTTVVGDRNVSPAPLSGRLVAVYVDYGTQPSTTDLIIKTKGDNGNSQTFLTLTNKNTSGWFYPRVAVHDVLGVTVTYDGTHAILEAPVIDDHLAVTVAQGNAVGGAPISIHAVIES